MDPLQPSPSEEALMRKIQSVSIPQDKVDQQKACKNQEKTKSCRWKQAKDKTLGTNSDYGFMNSFVRLFSQLKNNLKKGEAQLPSHESDFSDDDQYG